MNRKLNHTTGTPVLTVRNQRHVQATIDAICVSAVITLATRLRLLPIAPLQYLNSAIPALMNIAEIADVVVSAVTATSYKMVKLRTRWWVTGGEYTTIRS
jgi:hypothetical protein